MDRRDRILLIGLMVICTVRGCDNNGFVTLTNYKDLKNITHISESTIRRRMKRLLERGKVTQIKSKRGVPTKYRIDWLFQNMF